MWSESVTLISFLEILLSPVCKAEPMMTNESVAVVWALENTDTSPVLEYKYGQNVSYTCQGLESKLTVHSTCWGRLGWSHMFSSAMLPQCTSLLPYIVRNDTYSSGNASSLIAAQVCFTNYQLALPWVQDAMDIQQIAAVVARSSIAQLATSGGLTWTVPLGNHIPRFMLCRSVHLNFWTNIAVA
jgi:hypothetical protein